MKSHIHTPARNDAPKNCAIQRLSDLERDLGIWIERGKEMRAQIQVIKDSLGTPLALSESESEKSLSEASELEGFTKPSSSSLANSNSAAAGGTGGNARTSAPTFGLDGSAGQAVRRRNVRFPDGLQILPRHRDSAKALGLSAVVEFAAFREHALRTDRLCRGLIGWELAFDKWMVKSAEFRDEKQKRQSLPQRASPEGLKKLKQFTEKLESGSTAHPAAKLGG